MGLPKYGAALRRGVIPADGLEKGPLAMRTIEQALAPYKVSDPAMGRHYVEDHAVENGLLALELELASWGIQVVSRSEIACAISETFWDGVKEWQQAATTEG